MGYGCMTCIGNSGCYYGYVSCYRFDIVGYGCMTCIGNSGCYY